jgi:hypothetical protein
MTPEAMAKPALYCIENLCTSKELKMPVTTAPSKPYVTIRPAWKAR